MLYGAASKLAFVTKAYKFQMKQKEKILLRLASGLNFFLMSQSKFQRGGRNEARKKSLYTGKGDLGETGMFGCDQRISKSSNITEALGSLDEINSFLGFCKLRSKIEDIRVGESAYSALLEDVQQKLFIIQAQIAGSDKKIDNGSISSMEEVIAAVEKQLPEIHSFFVSGGSELSAALDYARTIARRAERRVVAVFEEGLIEVDSNTLKYLNRLSSLLYAMSRYANHVLGIEEESPEYK